MVLQMAAFVREMAAVGAIDLPLLEMKVLGTFLQILDEAILSLAYLGKVQIFQLRSGHVESTN